MILHLSRRNAASGYLGVYQQYRYPPKSHRHTPGQHRKWVARINHPPGKIMHLGVYPTVLSAARKVAQALTTIGRQPNHRLSRVRCRWGHVFLTDRDVYTQNTRGYIQRSCRRCTLLRMKDRRKAERERRVQEGDHEEIYV